MIERVERRGDTLRVLASDTVRVARVWVAVLDGDKVIEEREAVPVGANWWELVLPGGRMVVQARDLAGNVTEREVEAR